MARIALILGLVITGITLAVFRSPGPEQAASSSHREAPAISEDPTADNTDLYAFRSVDRPRFLTIISNWIPAEDPAAGPMYYQFSTRARYNVKIDRNGDGRADVVYRFRFGPSASIAFLRKTTQRYTVRRIRNGRSVVVARGVTPPNNIGPRFLGQFFPGRTYRELTNNRVTRLSGGGRVFAGQREDAFFADIGAIFDLLAFRRGTGSTGGGKDFFAGYAVHGVALQIPIRQLDDRNHIVGIWTTTDRRRIVVRNGRVRSRWVQVSRLGNPLVNEVIVPTTLKNRWNRSSPLGDGRRPFLTHFRNPILAALINDLYPGVVNAPERNRGDLVQVFLTGVKGLNHTGRTRAELLRINLSIPPTATPNRLGVLGGDNAGYPNGRRLTDDVIDIAEQAVAGALRGNPNASALGDGVDANDVSNLGQFPYENDPPSGFDNSKGQQKP